MQQWSRRMETQQVSQVLLETKTMVEEKIKTIEEMIDAHISQHAELEKQVNLLESIPGCGRTTAIGIIAELPNLDHYDKAPSFAAHAGVTPMNFTSGSSVRKKPLMSKVGSSSLRTMLYFPSNSCSFF